MYQSLRSFVSLSQLPIHDQSLLLVIWNADQWKSGNSQDPQWSYQGTVNLLESQPFSKTSLWPHAGLHQTKRLAALVITYNPSCSQLFPALLVPLKKYPNVNTPLQMKSEQHRIDHMYWNLFLYEYSQNINCLFHLLLYL